MPTAHCFFICITLIVLCNASVEILASSNACGYTETYTATIFNAPYTGTISGIKAVYNADNSDPMTCDDVCSTERSNWGCPHCGGEHKFMEEFMLVTDAATYSGYTIYPTTNTPGYESRGTTTCSRGCTQQIYVMDGQDIDDDEVTWTGETYSVTTDDQFMMQVAEGCCDVTVHDNTGYVCAEIYFIYDQVDGYDVLCSEPPSKFVWEELIVDDSVKPQAVANLNLNASTLTLDFIVDLDYLGASEADDNGYVYGTTYVIDFEDFNAHSDDIREPGTCQNRGDVFGLETWDELWTYSEIPNFVDHIGTTSYLAYPPSGAWSVQMSPDDECGTIRYTTSLTWYALTQCSNYDGSDPVKYIETEETDDNITLSGTLYVNVVSPFAYQGDYAFYRVYQLISQPFQIAIQKTVYVIDSTGINLLTIDVIAVYKDGEDESSFKLIVLTESAEYLQLNRINLGQDLLLFAAVTDTGLTTDDFRVSESDESSGCLTAKSYICSQLWQITIDNATCSPDEAKFTDFSGTYTIQFDAECKDSSDTYCTDWMTNHESEIVDSGTGLVTLTTTLTWKDTICEPEIFEVQFAAYMQFFEDAFATEVSGTHLYQVGEDTVYVRITTDYPSTHFDVFETELVNVWLCTFNTSTSPDAIEAGQAIGGCFSSTKDPDAFDGHDGHIYEKSTGQELEDFDEDESALQTNVVQFQFKVPTSIARDTLWVHAQIEVSLTVAEVRRRVLMDVGIKQEANQMDHFVDKVGIKRSAPVDNHPKPPIHNYHPQQPQQPQQPQTPPQQPVVLTLQSPWVIAVGCLLTLILTVNIVFMCLERTKRRTYYPVKAQDSEFDEYSNSERDAINVVSN